MAKKKKKTSAKKDSVVPASDLDCVVALRTCAETLGAIEFPDAAPDSALNQLGTVIAKIGKIADKIQNSMNKLEKDVKKRLERKTKIAQRIADLQKQLDGLSE